MSPCLPSRRFFLAGTLCLSILPGCTVPLPDTTPPAQPEPRPVPVPVSEGSWELVTSTFIGAGRIPGVPRATLAFRGGRVTAFSGCNSANAAAYQVDGRLEVAPLAATRRACPEPLNTFEARFFKLLRSQPVYRAEGDTLMLLDADHSARFRRMPDEAANAATRNP